MADVDNRNRNRRSNRAGQPNPKREARAKAAERHVATVSEACAKDIERSLAGVREFDGMPAGFVAAMKAKVQSAVAPKSRSPRTSRTRRLPRSRQRLRPRRRPSPSRSLPRKSPKLSPRLLRSPPGPARGHCA